MLTRRALLGLMLGAILECMPLDAQTAGIFGPPVNQYNVGRALWPLNAAETAAGFTWATINPYYPYCDSFRYKFVGDGVTDNTAIFNKAVASCAGVQDLFLETGVYNFTSKPSDLLTNTWIRGAGRLQTTLRASYNEGTATQGFLNITNGLQGIRIRDLRIVKGALLNGGAAIAAVSTASVEGGFYTFDGLTITTDGTGGNGIWNYALYLDGSLRPTFGIRDITIHDCYFFASSTDVAVFKSVVNSTVDAGFYPAGGTSDVVLLTGVSGTPTTNDTFNFRFNSTLSLDWVQDVVINNATNVAITDTANAIRVAIIAPRISSDTQARLMTNFASNSLWEGGFHISRVSWAKVTGTTGAITGSKNVTSCTRSAVGTYSCDITAAGFLNAPVCLCQPSAGAGSGVSCGGAPSATNTGNITTFVSNTAVVTDQNFSFMCTEP